MFIFYRNHFCLAVRQERPPHLRSEMVHPAFKERGRAIPHLDQKASRPPPKIIEGRVSILFIFLKINHRTKNINANKCFE